MRLFLSSLVFIVGTGLQAQQAVQEQLFWSDEFNGTGSPNSLNWSYDLGNSGWGNNEIQDYTNLQSNVRQESGNLVIEAHKLGNSWTSARIISHNKFNFTYGRIEFRAKLPSGIGTWPALWMLGESLFTTGWPACGEVDVMEHVGKDPGYVHSSLHTSSSSGSTVNTGIHYEPTVYSDFHIYSANWTSEKIEFSIDSSLFYTYNPPIKNSSTWPFTSPFFLILNIAMGGNWGSDPQFETNGLKNGIDPALSLARMEVDYVRVYQTASSIEDLALNIKDGSRINISPNPSDGKITFNIPISRPEQGTIFNSMGVAVCNFQLNADSKEIDLSHLPKGLYFVSILSNSETKTQKFILK